MITDVWSDLPIEDLSESQLSSFNELVLKDIKNESASEDKTILSNNLELWLFQLRVIRRDVEFQLSSQKSKDRIKFIELAELNDENEINEYKVKQNKWRMGAVRFLTAIEHKMLYVKLILSDSENYQ
jgi:hypothetical protein